jgi:hypothetical protein
VKFEKCPEDTNWLQWNCLRRTGETINGIKILALAKVRLLFDGVCFHLRFQGSMEVLISWQKKNKKSKKNQQKRKEKNILH